ncbi:hypothetical protein FAI41_05825 [Acetobacteraceae bacterium]|nr:hypothetical protein FAI41_05825 [Acetobacteraceae bacterium]
MIMNKQKWKERFPKLVNLLGCQFCQDFFLYGTTIEELTHDYVSRSGQESATRVISEINQLISLMEKGEVNPDQFLEEIREETIPNYDHLSTLEYFEAIQEALEKNFQEIYRK